MFILFLTSFHLVQQMFFYPWEGCVGDDFIFFRVERIYVGIRESISKRNIQSDLHFSRLPNVIAKLVAVAGILVITTPPIATNRNKVLV